MRREIWLTLVLAGLLAQRSSGEEPTAPEAAPSAESYLSQDKGADFIPAAKAWLSKQPPGDKTQQVASDLLMVATLVKSPAEIRLAKLRLLAEYPTSLTSQYLLTKMQLDGYLIFLKDCFKEIDWEQEPRSRHWFNQAMEMGTIFHGPKFADDGLLLEAALAAEDIAKAKTVRGQIRTLRPETEKTLEIALNEQLPAAEKMKQLKSHTTTAAGAYVHMLYATALTADERNDPELAGLVAERFLEEQQFSRTERFLAPVCEKTKDARLLYFLAWAQGATGKHHLAADSLAKVFSEFPDSPWAKPAFELSPVMRDLELNLSGHETGLKAAMKELTTSVPEVLEIQLQSGRGTKNHFTAYAALDVPVNSLEIHLEKNRELVAALKASRTLDRLYLKGDAKIRSFTDGPPIMYFAPTIRRKANGNWDFDFEIKENPPGNPIVNNLLSLLNSPSLAPKKSGKSPLQTLVEQGRFPTAVLAADGERTYRWLTPSHKGPELLVIEIRLDQQNRVTSAAWGDVFSAQIRSGKEGEVNLHPPTWPDRPLADQESSAIKATTDLLGVGVVLWADLINAINGTEDEELAGGKEPLRR